MDEATRRRFEKWKSAPVNWDPIKGGRRALLCFQDSKNAALGVDPTGEAFDRIADRMMNGHYYPPDALTYYAEALEQGRSLKPGDRVLQKAPILPFLPGLGVWQMVEIYAAERTSERCKLGYVTTVHHHGRGIWQAELETLEGELTLTVTSTTSPNSWLFWLGLPLARFLQLRARRRAIKEFAELVHP